MSSNKNKLQSNDAFTILGLPISSSILLSLTTGPVLLGILGVKSSLEGLQAAGVGSEEVFRGDRLPVLPFPSPQPENSL